MAAPAITRASSLKSQFQRCLLASELTEGGLEGGAEPREIAPPGYQGRSGRRWNLPEARESLPLWPLCPLPTPHTGQWPFSAGPRYLKPVCSVVLLRCCGVSWTLACPPPNLFTPPNTYPSLARSCSPSQTLPSLPRPNPTQVSSVGFFGFTVALTDVCQCLPHAVLPGTQSAGW